MPGSDAVVGFADFALRYRKKKNTAVATARRSMRPASAATRGITIEVFFGDLLAASEEVEFVVLAEVMYCCARMGTTVGAAPCTKVAWLTEKFPRS